MPLFRFADWLCEGLLGCEVGLLQVGDLLAGQVDLELEVLVNRVYQAAALRFDYEILELLEACVPLVKEPSCTIICCFTCPRTRVLPPFFNVRTALTSSS